MSQNGTRNLEQPNYPQASFQAPPGFHQQAPRLVVGGSSTPPQQPQQPPQHYGQQQYGQPQQYQQHQQPQQYGQQYLAPQQQFPQQQFAQQPPVSSQGSSASVNAKTSLMSGVLGSLFKKRTPEEVRQDQASMIVPIERLRGLVKGRELKLADFQLRSTVGTGTFGRVRVVKLAGCPDRSPFALKIMKKSEIIRLKQVEHVKSEKDILARIAHPFIVNLVAAFQDERRLFMLMEFVNGGELFSYLRKSGRLSFECSRFYAAEIVLAFEYLHSLNIIYRDLKPENLLIDAQGHIKITDFGFAKVVEDRTWTLCGTPEYLAPEIIQSKGHGKSVDWWALGILIFEMIAGYPPFYDESPFGIYQKVQEGVISFPRHFDLRAKEVVLGLLTADRSKRLGCLKGGAEDVKMNKFFKGVDWAVALQRGLQPVYVPQVIAPDDTILFDKYPESTEGNAPSITVDEQKAFFDAF